MEEQGFLEVRHQCAPLYPLGHRDGVGHYGMRQCPRLVLFLQFISSLTGSIAVTAGRVFRLRSVYSGKRGKSASLQVNKSASQHFA